MTSSASLDHQLAAIYYRRISPSVVFVRPACPDELVQGACKVCKTVKTFPADVLDKPLINDDMEAFAKEHRHSESV